MKNAFTWVIAATGLAACSPDTPSTVESSQAAPRIANTRVDEASGLQASRRNPGAWFVHNDDGPAVLFAIGDDGSDLGSFEVPGASNRDWEDITRVDDDGVSTLVIADTGDNFAQWAHVVLYFVPEPEPGEDGRYTAPVPVTHTVRLRYPDGPRDCESVAWDPASGQLLFLSKRDMPPRLYGIDLETALTTEESDLTFLGESVRFRPPSAEDMRHFGARDGRWVSQPTGMDIDASGTRAAVISYRSLYLFERAEGQSWSQALAQAPIELAGPPARKEESVAFSADGSFILVTSEGLPAPVFRFDTERVAP